jgi:hypothetical protein
VLDLATRLADLPEVQGQPPWPGYEYVKGWGVFALPFDSGHVLALRVFPENDFSPYRTIWHRDPQGRWAIYVDGPRLDTACPRYYGAACTTVAHARIGVEWTGPTALRVTVDEPSLEWTLTARQTPALRVMNALNPLMPLSSWRSAALLRTREWMARRVLGLGEIRMSGTMPSGHEGVLMPQRMYLIDESTAVLDGVALGAPARMHPNPRIGEVPLPARGVLAAGGGAWAILDDTEAKP